MSSPQTNPASPPAGGPSSWLRKGVNLPLIGSISLGSALLVLGIGYFVLFRRKKSGVTVIA